MVLWPFHWQFVFRLSLSTRKFMRNSNLRGSMRFPSRHSDCPRVEASLPRPLPIFIIKLLNVILQSISFAFTSRRNGARSLRRLHKSCRSESPQPRPTNVDCEFRFQEEKAAPKRKTFGGFFTLFLEFAAAPNGWHLKIAIIVDELVFVRVRAKTVPLMSCLRWDSRTTQTWKMRNRNILKLGRFDVPPPSDEEKSAGKYFLRECFCVY